MIHLRKGQNLKDLLSRPELPERGGGFRLLGGKHLVSALALTGASPPLLREVAQHGIRVLHPAHLRDVGIGQERFFLHADPGHRINVIQIPHVGASSIQWPSAASTASDSSFCFEAKMALREQFSSMPP